MCIWNTYTYNMYNIPNNIYTYIIHKHGAVVFVYICIQIRNIAGWSENILLKYAFLNINTDQKTRVR